MCKRHHPWHGEELVTQAVVSGARQELSLGETRGHATYASRPRGGHALPRACKP
jgi:hypothetical protein